MKFENGVVVKTDLRPFDLRVGDLIRIPEPLDYSKATVLRVVGIYKHIFTVESLTKTFRTSYQKKEYQLGHVKKYSGGPLNDIISSIADGMQRYQASVGGDTDKRNLS